MEAEEHDTLHQWENDLANDVSSIEEVEISSIVLQENQVNTTGSVEDASHASNTSASVGDTNHSSNTDDSTGKASHTSNASEANSSVQNSGQSSGTNVSANSQVQPVPGHDLTLVENHAGHTSTNNVEAQQAIKMSKQPPVSHEVTLNVAPKSKLEHARLFAF